MQKEIIRKYKAHYGDRWLMLKNNIRNNNIQFVQPIDIFIKKNLLSGSVIFLDLMGLQYIKIIKNLNILDESLKYSYGRPNKLHDNLILMNNIILKYKNIKEISNKTIEFAHKYCKDKTKIFLGFNYQFVKFNRLKFNFDEQLNLLFEIMLKNNFNCTFKKKQ